MAHTHASEVRTSPRPKNTLVYKARAQHAAHVGIMNNNANNSRSTIASILKQDEINLPLRDHNSEQVQPEVPQTPSPQPSKLRFRPASPNPILTLLSNTRSPKHNSLFLPFLPPSPSPRPSSPLPMSRPSSPSLALSVCIPPPPLPLSTSLSIPHSISPHDLSPLHSSEFEIEYMQRPRSRSELILRQTLARSSSCSRADRSTASNSRSNRKSTPARPGSPLGFLFASSIPHDAEEADERGGEEEEDRRRIKEYSHISSPPRFLRTQTSPVLLGRHSSGGGGGGVGGTEALRTSNFTPSDVPFSLPSTPMPHPSHHEPAPGSNDSIARRRLERTLNRDRAWSNSSAGSVFTLSSPSSKRRESGRMDVHREEMESKTSSRRGSFSSSTTRVPPTLLQVQTSSSLSSSHRTPSLESASSLPSSLAASATQEEPITPPPSPPFNATDAARLCASIQGVVHFSEIDVDGLSVPGGTEDEEMRPQASKALTRRLLGQWFWGTQGSTNGRQETA